MPKHHASPKTPSSARERILLTAHELFYREGIRATGIDRVIAESGVAKVTFYRHFPSKNDLIQAFLEYRHEQWMAWFRAALARHGGTPQALLPALAEWFGDAGFRGCAFINSVVELGGSQPAIVAMTQRHKQDMTEAIRGLLPPPERYNPIAEAIALAVDGAIVHAQLLQVPGAALAGLDRILKALEAGA
jgi:AcrR family transcriptional regulator